LLGIRRKIKGISTSPLLTIIIVLSLVIPTTAVINTGNYIGTTNFTYGQLDQINSDNITNSLNIQNIPGKKVHVRDIDIAYKMFGKG
jgi:hypothetical protein